MDMGNAKIRFHETIAPILAKLQSVMGSITAYPLRSECITTLLFPSLPESHHAVLFKMLEAVQPRLHTLGLVLEQTPSRSETSPAQYDPSRELVHVVERYDNWPNLRALRLTINTCADASKFCELLGKCPRLASLEWCWSNEILDQPDDTTSALEAALWPTMPELRHLSVTMPRDFSVWAEILDKVPLLEEVTFRDHVGINVAGGARDLLDRMRSLSKLKVCNWLVEMPGMDLAADFDPLEGLEIVAHRSEDPWTEEHHELSLAVSHWSTSLDAFSEHGFGGGHCF